MTLSVSRQRHGANSHTSKQQVLNTHHVIRQLNVTVGAYCGRTITKSAIHTGHLMQGRTWEKGVGALAVRPPRAQKLVATPIFQIESYFMRSKIFISMNQTNGNSIIKTL
jgi:hypothetical protein